MTATICSKCTHFERIIFTKDNSKNGVWVGKNAIVTTGYLRREIHVFIARSYAALPPLVYSPQTFIQAPPVLLAYYKPGYYKAVVRVFGSKLLHASTMYLNACFRCSPINNNDYNKSATYLNSVGGEMH